MYYHGKEDVFVNIIVNYVNFKLMENSFHVNDLCLKLFIIRIAL